MTEAEYLVLEYKSHILEARCYFAESKRLNNEAQNLSTLEHWQAIRRAEELYQNGMTVLREAALIQGQFAKLLAKRL